MGRVGPVYIGVVLAFALAATDAGASRSKRLELKLEGQTFARGSEVGIVLGWELGQCEQGAYEVSNAAGTVSVNGAATDKVTGIYSEGGPSAQPGASGLCGEGYEGHEDLITGSLTTITLSTAGKAVLTANVKAPIEIHLYLEGPSPSEPVAVCTYEFKKLSGHFATTGHAEFTAAGTGKLVKGASSPAVCAKSERSEERVLLFADHPGDIVETELIG